jgi:ABC-type antimicrobial peptide transport system permease subunit
MSTSIVGVFSGVATLLAAVGVFSLLHYATALRTREFGVRFALGATPSRVLAMVVREGVSMSAIGALAGAAAAIAAARAFQALLFGVQPWDAPTLPTCVAGALLLAAVASLAPALRAARLNPADALRSE